MTGSAFLRRLLIQLDFLNEDDRNSVVSFYRNKLAAADTLSEEEAIVKTFGSPEHIAKKLKESFFAEHVPQIDAPEPIPAETTETSGDFLTEKGTIETFESEKPFSDEPIQEDCENITVVEEADEFDPTPDEPEKEALEDYFAIESENAPEELASSEETDASTDFTQDQISPDEPEAVREASETLEPDEERDVLFSKPLQEDRPGGEIIHALENKEIVSLYGEKVLIETEKEAVFFEEEHLPIVEAKERYQEKADLVELADSYHTLTAPVVSDGSAITKDVAALGKTVSVDDDNPLPDNQIEEPELKTYPGLVQKLVGFSRNSKGKILFLQIFLSIVFSPLLLLVFGGISLIWLVSAAALIVSAVLLFLIMAALIIGGVVEIVYGFVQFSDSIAVAIIELGTGLLFFGVVLAVVGLIYEYIFAVVPRALKTLFCLLKKYLAKLIAVIYGGRA